MPVGGYEGIYEISNYGKVRSLERLVERKDGVVYKVKEKLLSQNFNSDGYPTVHLSKKREKQKELLFILWSLKRLFRILTDILRLIIWISTEPMLVVTIWNG